MADGGLRNRLGRFARAVATAPAEAPEAADDVVDVVEGELEDDFALPATPEAIAAELADVRRLLVEARAHRADLLIAGALAEIGMLDQEIRRLETAFESYAVRQQAAYEAQAEAAQNRRAQEWQRLRPQLESAQRHVSKLAFEMFAAVDRLRQVEGAAAAIGIAVGPTPAAQWVNGYWLEARALEYVRATGAMQPATVVAA